MSRVFEALRRAEEKRWLGGFAQPAVRRTGEAALRALASERHSGMGGRRRAQVVALASLKGGVGKTVIAANLAVYLRNLRPQIPTLLLAGDDDPLADRMFAGNGANPEPARAACPSAPAIRGGRYGVYTLRPSRRSWGLGSEFDSDAEIARLLGATRWDGLVVVDTPPDFGPRTRGALAASDVVLVPVSDSASLDKVAQLFALMDDWGLPRDRVHLLLSQLDLRIKYREGESRDVLALLVSEIRRRGWPLLGAFLSRTPKVASLYTKESGRPLPVAAAAPDSVVHRQFRHLADDVLGLLASAAQPAAPADQRKIGAELPRGIQACPSSRGAGRAAVEVDERVERIPPGPAVARPGGPRIDIVPQADHHGAVRLGRGSARRLMWPNRRAVGLVLLFVLAGPALAVATFLALDPGVAAIEVTRDTGGGLDGLDLTEAAGLAYPGAVPLANASGGPPSDFVIDGIARHAENVITMPDARPVADKTSVGLYDAENVTNTNVAFASFDWSSATDVYSEVRQLPLQPVPEPSTALLLAVGLVGLLATRRPHLR